MSYEALPLPPADPLLIRRVAFLGTPQIAVPTLRAIHAAGYDVPLVVSGADKRRGRGKQTSPTPVKAAALDLELSVTTEVDDLLVEHEANPIDVAVVVAFGQIIRPHVLEQIPMVNIHFSALPRWRGAAPVERAILEGDSETAIAIMAVAVGLDEGDVWASVPIRLGDEDTLHHVWESMSVDGAALLVDTLRSGFSDATPQMGDVVYARKLTTLDGWLDWSRSAVELSRVIRVGRAWTIFDGDRFKIHSASIVESSLPPGAIEDGVVGTAFGGLRLVVVQPAGKPRMDASAWANGAQPDGRSFDLEQPDG